MPWILKPLDVKRKSIPLELGPTKVVIGRTAPAADNVTGSLCQKRAVVVINVKSWQPVSATAEFKGPDSASVLVNSTPLTVGVARAITIGDKIGLVRADLPLAESRTHWYTLRVKGEPQPDAEVIELADEDEVPTSAKRQRTASPLQDDDDAVVEVQPGKAAPPRSPAPIAAAAAAAAAAGASNAAVLMELASNYACPVCQDLMVDATSVNCGHSFCYTCCQSWISNEGAGSSAAAAPLCPMCREPVTIMVPNLTTDNSIEKLVASVELDSGDAAEYKRRKEEARTLRGTAARTAVVLQQKAAAPAVEAPRAPARAAGFGAFGRGGQRRARR